MCWNSYYKLPKKIKAEQDIPVFKLANRWRKNSVISYYCLYPYKIGETTEEEPIKIDVSTTMRGIRMYTIETGYHSYLPDKVKLYKVSTSTASRIFVKYKSKSIDSFHQYPKDGLDKLVKVNCIIPKGSVYCVNDSGEVVSSRLMVKSIEEIKESKWYVRFYNILLNIIDL